MRTSWWRPAVPALATALALGLAGCTPTAPQPSSLPGPSGSNSAPTPPATGPTAPPPTPTSTTTDYAGPSPMPAADGGPMLWPTRTTTTVYLDGWATDQDRFGFVDTTGSLVVPPRYDNYEYCRDANGRASLVLAGSGDEHADILDLSGTVTGTIPGRFTDCTDDTYATFSEQVSETGPFDVGNGLYDLRSHTVLLPLKKNRVVTALDRRTVNVHEATGEYFLDLETGKRTPHLGYLADYSAPLHDGADPSLIPATDQPPDADTGREPRMGYLDRTGRWALKPSLGRTDGFHGGYAVVEKDQKEYFIDTSFKRLPGDWSSISYLGWGYQVSRDANGVELNGLLGPDLTVILKPQQAEIDCGWNPGSACGIHPRSGRAQLLLVPELTLAGTPDGFSDVLSRTLFTDATPDSPATHVLNTATGKTFFLDRPSFCGASAGWVSCSPMEDGAPPAVYDADGKRSGFREVVVVEDATAGTDSAYAWTVAGRYQGFIDRTGGWLYRESRYTFLED
ncbi:MAG: WG repeat-containing protein [Propionicimonas sp.]|uniref:WG repeat-containing protein n=1 Tax=Propionicimonas sp. TaxID=1955623 RepID=UPI002B20EF29|nr:WG repeat-containing protein [Propionicimonas sp.]MEA4944242.1 WG repeat-containing protein [Propionicimonas sp.]